MRNAAMAAFAAACLFGTVAARADSMPDLAAARATAAREALLLTPSPVEIRGEYGSLAYVRKTWTFEVVDLDQVPREYMSLDVEVVRNALSRDGVRQISGLRIYQNETLHVRGPA